MVYANIRSWLIYIEPGAKKLENKDPLLDVFLQNKPTANSFACLDMWAKYTQ